jgi:site-specific DNA-methyltransferase (adenine-specific)
VGLDANQNHAGVLQREKAAIGLFLTLREPTRPLLQEAATAGFSVPEYCPDQRFHRVQILTIAELLQGKQAQSPRYAPTTTCTQASRRPKGADP